MEQRDAWVSRCVDEEIERPAPPGHRVVGGQMPASSSGRDSGQGVAVLPKRLEGARWGLLEDEGGPKVR